MQSWQTMKPATAPMNPHHLIENHLMVLIYNSTMFVV